MQLACERGDVEAHAQHVIGPSFRLGFLFFAMGSEQAAAEETIGSLAAGGGATGASWSDPPLLLTLAEAGAFSPWPSLAFFVAGAISKPPDQIPMSHTA